MTKMPLILFFAVAFSLITSSCTKKVEVSQLQERGKLHYTINSQKPFSGQSTEYYSSGQIKEVINFKKGRPHGPYQSFYENGQPKKIGTYKVSKYGTSNRHGNWKYYGESGWLGFDTNYNEGDLHGRYVSYYENGVVWKNGQFKDGEQVGEWVENGGPDSIGFEKRTYSIHPDYNNNTWNDNRPKFVGSHLEYGTNLKDPIVEEYYDEDGNRHGKWITREYSGDVSRVYEYHHGEIRKSINYKLSIFSSNDREEIEYFDGEDNRKETNYVDGKIRSLFEYQDGSRTRYDYYRKDGTLFSKEIIDGLRIHAQYFYEDGSLKSEGPRSKLRYSSHKHGEWTYYNKDGSVRDTVDYVEGKSTSNNDAEVEKTSFYASGSKLATGPKGRYGEWGGMVRFFNEDGSLAFELEHDSGHVCTRFKLPDGTTQKSYSGEIDQYYKNGTTVNTLKYKHGALLSRTKFRPDGSILEETIYRNPPVGYGWKQRWVSDYKLYHTNQQLKHHISGRFSQYEINTNMERLDEFSTSSDHSIVAYDEEGDVLFKRSYKDKTEVRYHENGQLMYRAEFKIYTDSDGNRDFYVPSGKINFYDKNGKINGIQDYGNGVLLYNKKFYHGKVYSEDFYYKNGNRTRRLEYDFTGELVEETLYSKDHRSVFNGNDTRSMLERKEYYPSKNRWLPKSLAQYDKYTIHLDDDGEDALEYNSHITSSRNYYDNGQLQCEVQLTPHAEYPHHGYDLKGFCRFYYRNGLLFHAGDFGEGSAVRKYDMLEKMESFDIIGYFSNAAVD